MHTPDPSEATVGTQSAVSAASAHAISADLLFDRYCDSGNTNRLQIYRRAERRLQDRDEFASPRELLGRLDHFPAGMEIDSLPILAAAMLDVGLDPQPFFAALMDQAESAGRRLHEQGKHA